MHVDLPWEVVEPLDVGQKNTLPRPFPLPRDLDPLACLPDAPVVLPAPVKRIAAQPLLRLLDHLVVQEAQLADVHASRGTLGFHFWFILPQNKATLMP